MSSLAAPEQRPAHWLPIVGALVALLVETGVMAHDRIANQRAWSLPLVDLSRTSDVIALLFLLPFLISLVMMLARRREISSSRAWWTLGLSLLSLALLLVARQDALTSLNRTLPLGYALFLLAHVVWIALLMEYLRRGPLNPLRSTLRVLRSVVAITLLSFLVVIVSVLVSPFGASITGTPRGTVDAGVVLGAAVWSGNRPSPVLRERVKRAWELLEENHVRFVVLTGGNAPNEMTEGEVARQLLIEMGADPTRLVTERGSGSTRDQILYIRDTLVATERWTSFIIISDQFHLKRALEICEFNRIDAQGVSSESPLSPAGLAFYHFRESAALILYWLFGV